MLWVGIYPSFFVKVPKTTAIKIFIYWGGYCDKSPNALVWKKQVGIDISTVGVKKQVFLSFFFIFFMEFQSPVLNDFFFRMVWLSAFPYFLVEYNNAWIAVRLSNFNNHCIFYFCFPVIPFKSMYGIFTCRDWSAYRRLPGANQYTFLETASLLM